MSQNNIANFDPITKVWTGPMGKYPYPLDTYTGDLVLEALDKNPDKIVQINLEEGTEWVAKDLKIAMIRVAQNLARIGLKPEDVIGFNVINSEKVFPLVTGSVLFGASVNPLHVSFTVESIKQMFGKTEPKIVICDVDVYPQMRKALNELESKAKIYTVLGEVPGVASVDELLAPTGIENDFVRPKFEKTADKLNTSILCSSGTTGDPKGVNMTHISGLVWHFTCTKPMPIPYKVFSFSPIYWGSGICSLMSAILNENETKISTGKSFNVETLVHVVEKYRPILLTLPPSHLIPFLNSPESKTCDFSSVKVIISFGSIVTEDLRKRFKKAFPNIFLSTIYGMTEFSITYAFPGDSYDGLTVGKIVANVQLKIVDENENNLGFLEQGEIRLKPEYEFMGYYNDPKATADSLDSEGYFKTGDIGYFDETASLFVTDRIKETFKHNGFHVSPIELETSISEIDGVEFVAVIGIPDPIAIDLPAAVIKKLPGYEKLSEKDIYDAIANKFPKSKHLVGGVYFVDKLPMTPTGKIKKNLVKQMAIKMFENSKHN